MILDIVAGTILFLSMLIAWFRGFIREVLTILALGCAGLCALYGSPYLVPYMVGIFPQTVEGEDGGTAPAFLMGLVSYEIIAIGLSYLLLFVVTFVIFALISHFLSNSAKEAGLGALDRSLGLIFGLLRAVLLIAVLFIPFNVLMDAEDKENWFGEAISLPYVDGAAEVIRAAIPSPVEETAEKEEEDSAEDDGFDVLDILQNKARQNAEEALDIIKKAPEAKPDEQDEGYEDLQREALQKLFEDQE